MATSYLKAEKRIYLLSQTAVHPAKFSCCNRRTLLVKELRLDVPLDVTLAAWCQNWSTTARKLPYSLTTASCLSTDSTSTNIWILSEIVVQPGELAMSSFVRSLDK